MASVVVNGDTSGAVTLSAPAVAGTVTVTLPSTSGVMAVGGGTITTLTTTSDITVQGVTVGCGAGAVATNTAVGSSALAANSTGAQSTAIGRLAGATTNAAYLTAVGYQAARYNTGDGNTAIGTNALLVGSGTGGTGSNNTAIGKDSLFYNTSASNNTAVGYQAGYTNQTGTQNVFLGYGAGYTNNNNYNVFIGMEAGRLSTGTLNCFVGYNSGYNMTTGTKNTILGAYNGNQGLDIRTASNYIVLSDGDGNPRGIFDGSGNFLVNTTSQVLTSRVSVNFTGNNANGATFNDTGNGNGAGFIIFAESGTAIGSVSRVASTSAVAYNTMSDYRLKTVTGTVTGQGTRIDALNPVDYLWKDGGQQARGFLAHEFQTVYPNSVTGDKDAVDADGNPKHQSMQASSSEVIADLVAEIQSLRKRLAAANL